MKIWIIQKGEYSDRHVVALATSQELADKAVEIYSGGYDKASAFEMETDDFPSFPPGMRPYNLVMRKDGTALWVECNDFEVAAKSGLYYEEFAQGYTVRDFREGVRFEFFVWATDEEHAVKVANERRTQLIATGEWDRLAAEVKS